MRNKFQRDRLIFVGLNLILALAGCLRIFRATYWGVWAYSDSASYFSAARNFIYGQGLIIQQARGGTVLFQQFPPLYPVVLGLGARLFGDIFMAARWINIICFGLFLFLSGEIVFQQSGRTWISLAAPLFLLVSPMMVNNFTGAMTEPIFFVLMLLSILLLYRLVTNPTLVWQVLFVLVLMLLPLTRYVGITIVAVDALFLLLFPPGNIKGRFINFLLAALFSALPILLWVVHLFMRTQRIGGRSVRFTMAFFGYFREAIGIVITWLQEYLPYFNIYEDIVPSSVRLSVLLVLLLGFFATAVIAIRNIAEKMWAGKIAWAKYLIFPAHMLAFCFFIMFSYSITLRSYVIDARQLSPLIPMTIIFLMCSFSVFSMAVKNQKPVLIGIILLAFAIFLRFNFYASQELVDQLNADGAGFTARQYQESGIIEAIQAIPNDTPIISNSAGFILLHDNRYPIQVDQFHQRKYGKRDAYGERTFREGGAALVLLLPDFHNYYGEGSEEMLAAVTEGLYVSYSDDTGAIYYYADQ